MLVQLTLVNTILPTSVTAAPTTTFILALMVCAILVEPPELETACLFARMCFAVSGVVAVYLVVASVGLPYGASVVHAVARSVVPDPKCATKRFVLDLRGTGMTRAKFAIMSVAVLEAVYGGSWANFEGRVAAVLVAVAVVFRIFFLACCLDHVPI